MNPLVIFFKLSFLPMEILGQSLIAAKFLQRTVELSTEGQLFERPSFLKSLKSDAKSIPEIFIWMLTPRPIATNASIFPQPPAQVLPEYHQTPQKPKGAHRDRVKRQVKRKQTKPIRTACKGRAKGSPA